MVEESISQNLFERFSLVALLGELFAFSFQVNHLIGNSFLKKSKVEFLSAL